MMSAVGALVLADADRLVRTASVVGGDERRGACSGTDVAFAAAYQLARPHPGQVAVAAELRHLLRDSTLQTGHHGHAHKVQDPYSLRCIPQVHGAVRDTLDHLRRVLDIELNSATDNPLVFPGGGIADEATIATGGGRVISGGNFHGEPIALALDFAKIALAELGSISERRTALLVDPRLNGSDDSSSTSSTGASRVDDRRSAAHGERSHRHTEPEQHAQRVARVHDLRSGDDRARDQGARLRPHRDRARRSVGRP